MDPVAVVLGLSQAITALAERILAHPGTDLAEADRKAIDVLKKLQQEVASNGTDVASFLVGSDRG